MDERPGDASEADQPATPDPAPPPPAAAGPPPPPAPAPQWATPMSAAPAAPRSNGMAVAALVLGIVGLMTFWTVWLGAILGILAIVFGIVGMNRAKQGAPNKGLAIAGLVLGILALGASLLWLAALVAIVDQADTSGIFDEIEQQIEFCLENPNDPSC